MLHGRGSDGAEFAEDLFSSVNSQGQTLPQSLPNFRWVFPSSGLRWSDRFQEDMPAWFDAYSLDDPAEKKELQVDGIRESVVYILDLLSSEIQMVGDSKRVYLGGISQGMAITLWSLLCAPGKIQGQLGGVLGFCGWLPFAAQAEGLVKESTPTPGELGKQLRASELFLGIIDGCGASELASDTDTSVLSTQLFLSHGTDDTWVSTELGHQVHRVLEGLGFSVEWNEFTGAEGDGHWIKEPEGFDQITRFIQNRMESLEQNR